ncbi:MAG: GTP cyclohydrolase I FolE [Pseudomonas sp.]|nr:GTP cyclohydrolase I FolE [Pseudomonas sp.]
MTKTTAGKKTKPAPAAKAPAEAKTTRPSRSEAEAAIRTLIEWIGENPAREGLRDTPRRVIKAFDEYCAGYDMNPADVLAKTFSETGGYDGPVLVKCIEFESRCEHHMAPFIGKAHVAYIPTGKVLGLSKVARIVDMYARRLQIQENLTKQIADAIQRVTNAAGVAVVIEAKHMCMMMRGVEKQNSVMSSSVMLGAFRESCNTRHEFLQLIGRNN